MDRDDEWYRVDNSWHLGLGMGLVHCEVLTGCTFLWSVNNVIERGEADTLEEAKGAAIACARRLVESALCDLAIVDPPKGLKIDR